MSVWELPTSLTVGGVGYSIRSDFRAVLDILQFFNDGDYEMDERCLICLTILYEDFDSMDSSLYEEALLKAIDFIDAGMKGDEKQPKPSLMDWEQDAPIIIPAINKVSGCEIRAVPYVHWWTFLGYYMEIGESLYTTVLGIRSKRAKHKKLEKYEQEFYKENRAIVQLKRKETEAERRRKEELNALFGIKR